jgi:hypothetical protein
MKKVVMYSKGYYSILQYVPDVERAEGVNVGVVLICPARNFLKARTTKDNNRVVHFFGTNAGFDGQRLTILKQALEERITAIQTLEEFQRFVETRANHLRLIAPRPIKVTEPEAELDRLFAALVEEPQPAAISTEELAFA